jgi:hypothetical protein
MNTTTAAPASTWTVTAIAHPELRDVCEACEDCLALAHDAAAHARVTGSTGATFSLADSFGAVHSATVARTIATLTLENRPELSAEVLAEAYEADEKHDARAELREAAEAMWAADRSASYYRAEHTLATERFNAARDAMYRAGLDDRDIDELI